MSRLRSAMHKSKKIGQEVVETSKPKRKRTKTAVKEEQTTNAASPSTYHTFPDPADVVQLRSQLLNWYDKEKRELPWRTLAMTEPDLNIRTYAAVAHSAGSSSCYSGGDDQKHLQNVVTELKGQMPQTVDSLLKQLPGVGRYTAAAIGSIALGQVTGAVDGNVIRVLCRLRAIGADCTSPAVTEALWGLTNALVDPERPGDFNQAMMELGARVCTPKGPLCSQCPVQSHCHSYRKVHIIQEQNSKKLLGKLEKNAALPDIEDCMNSGTCPLCPSEPWNNELGVQNFPRKPAKKPPRVERTLTCVVIRPGEDGEDEYLLTQRPDKGLLAGLWEFPSLLLEEENTEMKQKRALCAEISRILGTHLTENLFQFVGEVVHIFSHIHQTYVVHSVRLKDGDTRTQTENTQWLTKAALQEAAVSTGVKKIVKLYDSVETQKEQTSKMARVCWWFFFSKVIELSDTVYFSVSLKFSQSENLFFILRKKNNQLTFLHVYHHGTMIFNWWAGVKYVAGGQSFFIGLVNTFVHVVMYSYYGLAAIGPHMQKYLWWKRYLTSLQLVQFVMFLVHTGYNLFTECDFPDAMNIVVFGYCVTLIILFSNFYYQSYLNKKKQK
nr:ELOVL fatty acid elongase 8b [Eleutheronema tetradactylum]